MKRALLFLSTLLLAWAFAAPAMAHHQIGRPHHPISQSKTKVKKATKVYTVKELKASCKKLSSGVWNAKKHRCDLKPLALPKGFWMGLAMGLGAAALGTAVTVIVLNATRTPTTGTLHTSTAPGTSLW